jgi:hypothetical protein
MGTPQYKTVFGVKKPKNGAFSGFLGFYTEGFCSSFSNNFNVSKHPPLVLDTGVEVYFLSSQIVHLPSSCRFLIGSTPKTIQLFVAIRRGYFRSIFSELLPLFLSD